MVLTNSVPYSSTKCKTGNDWLNRLPYFCFNQFCMAMAIILVIHLTKTTFRSEGTELPQMICNHKIQRSPACTHYIATPVSSGLFVPTISSEQRDTADIGEFSVLRTTSREHNLSTPILSEGDNANEVNANRHNFNEISISDIPPSLLNFSTPNLSQFSDTGVANIGSISHFLEPSFLDSSQFVNVDENKNENTDPFY